MKEEQKRLKQEVRRWLEEAERIDAEEDARYGRNSYGDELPAELQRREERLQRIREAKRALEARVRQEAEATAKEPDGEGSQQNVKPEEKDQYNFTDPESRILKGPDGFLQGYNAQIAVEPVLQLIVGQAVTQAANDKKQLLPMLAAVEQQSGHKPSTVLADNGYLSEENLQGAAKMQVEAYVAAGKQKHSQIVSPCPRGPIPQSATALERMRRKLQTIIGRKIYARRKAIVEPVFGQIKHRQGFRQFLLRGVNKVRGEWALVCMTHNILKFHSACFRSEKRRV